VNARPRPFLDPWLRPSRTVAAARAVVLPFLPLWALSFLTPWPLPFLIPWPRPFLRLTMLHRIGGIALVRIG
jgi:hypothetical protein